MRVLPSIELSEGESAIFNLKGLPPCFSIACSCPFFSKPHSRADGPRVPPCYCSQPLYVYCRNPGRGSAALGDESLVSILHGAALMVSDALAFGGDLWM